LKSGGCGRPEDRGDTQEPICQVLGPERVRAVDEPLVEQQARPSREEDGQAVDRLLVHLPAASSRTRVRLRVPNKSLSVLVIAKAHEPVSMAR
jgi:hypothetical protein